MTIKYSQFMTLFEYPTTSLILRFLGITTDRATTVDPVWVHRLYAESL